MFVLEVNPRASRTVPFVSKSIGVPLAKIAARVMAGQTAGQMGARAKSYPHYYSVKEATSRSPNFLKSTRSSAPR